MRIQTYSYVYTYIQKIVLYIQKQSSYVCTCTIMKLCTYVDDRCTGKLLSIATEYNNVLLFKTEMHV